MSTGRFYLGRCSRTGDLVGYQVFAVEGRRLQPLMEVGPKTTRAGSTGDVELDATAIAQAILADTLAHQRAVNAQCIATRLTTLATDFRAEVIESLGPSWKLTAADVLSWLRHRLEDYVAPEAGADWLADSCDTRAQLEEKADQYVQLKDQTQRAMVALVQALDFVAQSRVPAAVLDDVRAEVAAGAIARAFDDVNLELGAPLAEEAETDAERRCQVTATSLVREIWRAVGEDRLPDAVRLAAIAKVLTTRGFQAGHSHGSVGLAPSPDFRVPTVSASCGSRAPILPLRPNLAIRREATRKPPEPAR
jgi:hypothetical protein